MNNVVNNVEVNNSEKNQNNSKNCLTLNQTCNSKDNNCSLKVYYLDRDGDGFGDNNEKAEACERPAGFVEEGNDCNDLLAEGGFEINPGVQELISDQIDNDCDSKTDEQCECIDNICDEEEECYINWKFQVEHQILSVAISNDNITYVGACPCKVYALDFNRNIIWEASTCAYNLEGRNEYCTDVAIGFDDNIYFTHGIDNHRSYISSFDINGNITWSYEIGSIPWRFAISHSNILYASSQLDGQYKIHAIDPSENEIWNLDIDEKTNPIITKNNSILIFTSTNEVQSISSSGQMIWNYSILNEAFKRNLLIGKNGDVYLGTSSKLVVLNKNGELKWEKEIALSFDSAVIDFDGTLYVHTIDRTAVSEERDYLTAIDEFGNIIWSTQLGVSDSMMLANNNILYISGYDRAENRDWNGGIYAVNINDGSIRWKLKTLREISLINLNNQGDLFVEDGKLFTVKTNSQNLNENAFWPKSRIDIQNTGQAKQ